MRTDGIWFKDQAGRALLLRGANLGGSTKVPARPNGATYLRDRFFDHRDVSFVGRPFPLDEADEHFRRLRAWGLTFLRLLVTWEAIDRAGPGQYDQEYLTYLHTPCYTPDGANARQVIVMRQANPGAVGANERFTP